MEVILRILASLLSSVNTCRKVGSNSNSLSLLPRATYFRYKAAGRKNRPCSVLITPEYNVVINHKYKHLETEFLESRHKASLNFSKHEGTVDARK